MNCVSVFRQGVFFRRMKAAITMDELLKGLLGQTSAGSGMLLIGASRIHTYGMKFPIDVLYLNQKGTVIGFDKNLPPHREGTFYPGAKHVIEFNAGTIQREKLAIGDKWSWLVLERVEE